MSPEQRAAIADILERVAADGLPGPRDLDVALDAIDDVIGGLDPYSDAAALANFVKAAGDRFWMIAKGNDGFPGSPLFHALLVDPAKLNTRREPLSGDSLADVLERARVPVDEAAHG